MALEIFKYSDRPIQRAGRTEQVVDVSADSQDGRFSAGTHAALDRIASAHRHLDGYSSKNTSQTGTSEASVRAIFDRNDAGLSA